MKLLGGAWSRADLLALIGVIVAVLGVWIAHRDTMKSDDRPQAPSQRATVGSGEPAAQPATIVKPAIKAVQRSSEVSSGQVNFGCEETQQIKTPEVFFGANARDIQPRTDWVQTDHVKSQNQQVIYDKDSEGRIRGIFAQGALTGVDKQLFNCPGGGHGALALHVTWTED